MRQRCLSLHHKLTIFFLCSFLWFAWFERLSNLNIRLIVLIIIKLQRSFMMSRNRSSDVQFDILSRGKTTGTGRVKVGADHHTPLGMGPHHVTPRLALHLAYLQFVRLDRWGSPTRFLHYSYHYHWSRDHPCSLPLLRDSYEPGTPLANSQ